MSVLEQASDVNLSVKVILELCKKLNIAANGEDDVLDDDAIIMLDNEIANENITSLDTNLNSIPLLETENKAYVTLLNVSDYLYASSCQKTKINEYDTTCLKNNWLNKNKTEWTMTTKYELPTTDPETNEEIIPDNNNINLNNINNNNFNLNRNNINQFNINNDRIQKIKAKYFLNDS